MNFVRRFSPLAIIIIMVIVQIIETVVVHVSATRWSILIYLLILNIVITLILLSQTQNYQLRRQDFIRKIFSPLDKNFTKFKLISDLSVYFTEANTTTDSE